MSRRRSSSVPAQTRSPKLDTHTAKTTKTAPGQGGRARVKGVQRRGDETVGTSGKSQPKGVCMPVDRWTQTAAVCQKPVSHLDDQPTLACPLPSTRDDHFLYRQTRHTHTYTHTNTALNSNFERDNGQLASICIFWTRDPVSERGERCDRFMN